MYVYIIEKKIKDTIYKTIKFYYEVVSDVYLDITPKLLSFFNMH